MSRARSAALQVLGGLAAALLLTECGLRLSWGQSTLLPPIYASHRGQIQLSPGASSVGRLPASPPYTIQIDDRGLRSPVPDEPTWLLIGDSLPFGLGVDGAETAAAQMTAAGVPAAAAGVPAYSIADALAHAEGLPAPGVIVLPNAVDDDRQGAARLHAAHDVVGGRLLRRSAPGWARRFYASPLAHAQLPMALMRALRLSRGASGQPQRPDWATAGDGGRAAWAAVGEQIQTFADAHPSVAVRVAWVPHPAVAVPGRADGTAAERLAVADGGWSDAAAVDGLTAGLGAVPLWDLRSVFSQAGGAFLRRDTHLSAEGNARLADALRERMQAGGEN